MYTYLNEIYKQFYVPGSFFEKGVAGLNLKALCPMSLCRLCSVCIRELSINVFAADGVLAAPRVIERSFYYQELNCPSETD